MQPADAFEERILIFAPHGRDAQVMCAMLTRDGFGCATVDSVGNFTASIAAGAGAAIVAEEALQGADTAPLRAWLEAQPHWSDFPFVVLLNRSVGVPADGARTRLGELGNVILLERPLNAQTLRSAATSVLRARRRQYQARDVLLDRERTAASLRHSQQALVHLNETLEARIDERTRALAQANDRLMNEVIERERVQAAMVQLQKMEAIGRLTGGIAHDFNNLLNVVQGSMDLILLMSKDEAAKKRAEVARRACQRGGKLTSQLLAFSRNQSLDLRPLDVGTLFEGVRELVTTSLGASIRLSFEIADPSTSIMADMNQMEMALLNLAINARDAMDGGGQLRFHAGAATPPSGLLPPGDYVRIAVTDSGAGMPPEVAARVFEPFFTTKGVGKGTGLGLSQVYGMAQQSGGAARILSEQGVGTTVEIWLRAAGSGADTLPAAAAAVAASPRPGVRILVVEDDDFVRESMVESLEALGHTVAQAPHAEAALLELRRARPGLIITDYLMPGMTGAELVLRARAELPGVPMIIATGYADMKAIEQVIGDDMLLRKPFQLNELAAIVERALQKVEGETAAN
ncbi:MULTISPECIES: response regulator [unclassified Massilia]|uniref:response regulator n=1 Tax=unclassified Massilia TaxID=2609279 RepID=UPI00178764D2|nr:MULTISPECIES: response regulator [unclassified Massilia]MBD8530759.1 response regulator [Massilia sp. CFBP 13647]MBD8674458.1 response regulator [Massilia sp. CFBP 13721]